METKRSFENKECKDSLVDEGSPVRKMSVERLHSADASPIPYKISVERLPSTDDGSPERKMSVERLRSIDLLSSRQMSVETLSSTGDESLVQSQKHSFPPPEVLATAKQSSDDCGSPGGSPEQKMPVERGDAAESFLDGGNITIVEILAGMSLIPTEKEKRWWVWGLFALMYPALQVTLTMALHQFTDRYL